MERIEEYIDESIEKIIEVIRDNYRTLTDGRGNPEAILKVLDGDQFITVSGANWDSTADDHEIYVLVEDSGLICISYSVYKDQVLSFYISLYDDIDELTIQKFETSSGLVFVRLLDENNDIIRGKNIPVKLMRKTEEKPVRELLRPVGINQIKNRGIVALNREDAISPEVYELISFIKEGSKEGRTYVSSKSIQESHIDDLFDDGQLISTEFAMGSTRWAIVDAKVLTINCVPSNNQNRDYYYYFSLSESSFFDRNRYYAEEIVDSTGKRYTMVRCDNDPKIDGVKKSTRINEAIKSTSIPQLIERGNKQYTK